MHHVRVLGASWSCALSKWCVEVARLRSQNSALQVALGQVLLLLRVGGSGVTCACVL